MKYEVVVLFGCSWGGKKIGYVAMKNKVSCLEL